MIPWFRLLDEARQAVRARDFEAAQHLFQRTLEGARPEGERAVWSVLHSCGLAHL